MIIFLLSYFGLAIGVRTILLYRKTKVGAIKNFGKKDKIKRAERIILFALFLLIIVAANFLFIPGNYKYLIPFKVLEIAWLQTAGFILSILGILFGFISQSQMKDSWRLGIDNNEDVELVTSGFFSISRNPIYLGLGASFVGFFFIAPNLVSLIFVLTMYYGVHNKIKDEEEFLLNKFGSAFETYKMDVRKWF